MALLVPNIGEQESLRYLVNQNGFVQTLSETAPRNLALKLFTSNTTPAETDVPSATAYFEPYTSNGTNGYGAAPVTGYHALVDNRADQSYTGNYGILLNGSRWTISTDGGGTPTASYPEETFTFTGAAGSVYGYYVVRANNMPVTIQGVVDAASASAGTTVAKTNVVGVIGNKYITLANTANVTSDITLGMRVTSDSGNTGPNGIAASTVVVGVDRALRRIYLNNALVDNIQSSNNNAAIDFDFSKVTATAHGLASGDVIYIARGTTNTTTTVGTYTVFSVIDANNFTTSQALDGTGNLSLYSSIMYAERFTNGPYAIQNNGDQIKVTLNISLA